ncbi:MAG: WD40 repeat domain-containing protein [Anaerolineales bacterium]
MNKRYSWILFIILLTFAGGCSLFSTSQPTPSVVPSDTPAPPTSVPPTPTEPPPTEPPPTVTLPEPSPTQEPSLTPTESAALSLAVISTQNAQTVQMLNSWQTEIRELTSAGLAFSPDGDRIAAALSQGELRVWWLASPITDDNFSPLLLETFNTSESQFGVAYTGVAFSPHGRYLASTVRTWVEQYGEYWGAVKRWGLTAEDEETLTLIGTSHRAITSVVFSPDGKKLASGTEEGMGGGGTLKVWDAVSGEKLLDVPYIDWITGVSYSPDGDEIAGVSYGAVLLWDAESGAQMVRFAVGSGPLWGVAFSPDGNLLAVRAETEIFLLDPVSGEILHSLPRDERITAMSFSPQGDILAVADAESLVLWDVVTGQRLTDISNQGEFLSVAFSPDGLTLSSLTTSGQLFFWGVVIEDEEPSGDSSIVPVNASQIQQIDQVGVDQPTDLSLSPDGESLAVARRDGVIELREFTNGQLTHLLEGHTGWVYRVEYSPNGEMLASASMDGTAKLWDLESGAILYTLSAHEGEVSNLAFDPQGEMLATVGEDGKVLLWESATGLLLNEFEAHNDWVWAVDFSPDGGVIATASADNSVRLLNVETGETLNVLQGHTSTVWDVAFSHDGQTLATASWDGTIKLWRASNGNEVRTLRDHQDWVYQLDFSPDDRLLASVSKDGTVRVWDAADGSELATLHGHSDRVWSVTFSPDGSTLVSASDDDTLRVWGLPK